MITFWDLKTQNRNTKHNIHLYEMLHLFLKFVYFIDGRYTKIVYHRYEGVMPNYQMAKRLTHNDKWL